MRALKLWLWIGGLALLPCSLAAIELAFAFPELTERVYAQRFYPAVVDLFAGLNQQPGSIAEILVAVTTVLAILWWLVLRRRRRRARAEARELPLHRRLLHAAGYLWVLAGVVAASFLLLWGFNYARPALKTRMELTASGIQIEEVLAAGDRCARETRVLFQEHLSDPSTPTELPMSFYELNASVDRALTELALPGDRIAGRATPAKRLRSSTLFAHLGISGIYVPFTGEPSVNGLVPDATLPMVLAHEKAHQRGITHEGEANFVAFLACSSFDAPSYLRYSAYLFASQHLIGQASLHLPPEEVAPAWASLGEGPLADLEAIREFWRRYQGAATEAASQVNDRYLRALGVREGVASYDQVVELLIALDRDDRLVSPLSR